jgi:hypothetical protein
MSKRGLLLDIPESFSQTPASRYHRAVPTKSECYTFLLQSATGDPASRYQTAASTSNMRFGEQSRPVDTENDINDDVVVMTVSKYNDVID